MPGSTLISCSVASESLAVWFSILFMPLANMSIRKFRHRHALLIKLYVLMCLQSLLPRFCSAVFRCPCLDNVT